MTSKNYFYFRGKGKNRIAKCFKACFGLTHKQKSETKLQNTSDAQLDFKLNFIILQANVYVFVYVFVERFLLTSKYVKMEKNYCILL